jgi:hypothetical protein
MFRGNVMVSAFRKVSDRSGYTLERVARFAGTPNVTPKGV